VNQTPDFADRLAATQDQILASSEDELATTRRRFLAAANAPARPANRMVWVATPVVLTTVAAAAAALLYVVTSVEPTLTATSAGANVAIGDWISSTGDDVGIAFSDGTQITLDAQSQARIVSMDSKGAHLLLERGHADLDVVHTGSADWSLTAGPFNVLVTGTHFGTDWSPEDQTLVIRMAEGSVVVTGPLLDGEQIVSDVGTLTVSLRDNRTQLTNGPLPEVAAVVEEEPEVEAEAPLRIERQLPPAPVEAQVDVSVVTWKDLAGDGKYKDALSLAREVGVDGILQRSNSTDLYLFGDMARLAGDYGLAGTSFESLRNRFPGTRYAAEASFMLGKMAYDQDKNYRGAASWLNIHLDERPNGASTEDAMALLMLSYDKAGDRPSTRSAARNYLDRFPKGKSASQAKTFSKRR